MQNDKSELRKSETERNTRVAEGYMRWIKLVTTSLAAFLGVLFAVDSQKVGYENNLQLFGWMCILTVLSILAGFVVLFVEPFLLGIIHDRFDSQEFDRDIHKKLKTVIILSSVWAILVVLTFVFMILLLVNRYLF